MDLVLLLSYVGILIGAGLLCITFVRILLREKTEKIEKIKKQKKDGMWRFIIVYGIVGFSGVSLLITGKLLHNSPIEYTGWIIAISIGLLGSGIIFAYDEG